MNLSTYESVIGLEVHAQLSTKTKLFCGCSTSFGNSPNSNVCPICLGHPGVLPVLNKKVVEYAVLLGIATNCKINNDSVFARKNYFYPDSPKGFQTSQYERPICENGFVQLNAAGGNERKIGITRIHIEEDAGKSIHNQSDSTFIDLNRCGVPLLEIVSEPDLRSAEEASSYLMKMRQLVQYLGICDGNMEEGSLRCDANVSVRLIGEKKLGVKTEIKNMNSFKNVEKAVNFEINRQIEIIKDGGVITQQTLLWNADLNESIPMRSKEEAHDYRYFPEPDLMPISLDQDFLNQLQKSLPELPDKMKERFVSQYNLPIYDAEILTSTKQLADYYESAVKCTKDYKSLSNWIMVDVLKILNERKIDINDFSITAQSMGKLVELISTGVISGKMGKDVFSIMLDESKDPETIIKEKNLIQISDSVEIEKIVLSVIEKHSNQVEQFVNGEEKVFGFFVGQVMKESKGKANPKLVNDILKQKLSEQRPNK